ncbi:MAG: hypothetical protein Q8M76_19275, partial [Spirochaetaceae bacterium]|nr:hypothetical protein [Spirochaetaceae bacterium]
MLAGAGLVAGKRITGHADYAAEYKAAGATFMGYADLKGKSDAPPPITDGLLVTSLRSRFFRKAMCEALSAAVSESRRLRGIRGMKAAAKGMAQDAPKKIPAVIAYCTYTHKGVPGTELLLLAASVRRFGGGFASSPIWVMHPAGESIPRATLDKAALLGVELKSYSPVASLSAYPFASKAVAAAEVERLSEGVAETLIWFDRDSLVLGDLAGSRLRARETIAYRPVNARNIGQDLTAKPNAFWARAYELAGVDPDASGSIVPYMEEKALRFYMAAGLVMTRPERAVLRRWLELSSKYAADPALAAECRASAPHMLFMHQAALSLAIAGLCPEAERRELS